MKAVLTKTMLIAAAAATLGGCSSYGNERPRFAYFIVPCNTPGAIAAQPMNTADNAVVAQPQEPLPDTMNAQSADTSQKTETTCLVAAANSRPWTSGYAGYGFPPNFSSPYRRSGGIGVILHGGGRRDGHYGGGGHRRH